MSQIFITPQFIIAPGFFENSVMAPRLVLIALLIAATIWRESFIPKNWKPIAVFIVVNSASTITAADPWTAIAGFYPAPNYGLLALSLVTLAYLCGSGLHGAFGGYSPTGAFSFAGAVLGVFAVAQAVAESSLLGFALPQGRAVGFRGSPVFFAAALIPCFLSAWNRARTGGEFWDAALLGLITLGLVAARAKGAVLACAVGVWAMETSGARRWAWLLACAALLWAYLALPIGNNPERVELLWISLQAFLDRPLLGWGPDNFIFAFGRHATEDYVGIVGSSSLGQSAAHNDIAQVAATLGIAGLLSYGWLIFSLARASRTPLGISVLVAAWFQAQVNPIPADVMVLFALLLGSENTEGGRER